MNTRNSPLTVFICNDNNRVTSIATSLASRCKHCDAVVGKFFQSCQCSICSWSNHYLRSWVTTRNLCVGDCIIHYYAILIVYWYVIPLNKNACRRYAVSCDISWGSIWYCNNDNTKTIFPKIIAHVLKSNLNMFVYLSSGNWTELTPFVRRNLINLMGNTLAPMTS